MKKVGRASEQVVFLPIVKFPWLRRIVYKRKFHGQFEQNIFQIVECFCIEKPCTEKELRAKSKIRKVYHCKNYNLRLYLWYCIVYIILKTPGIPKLGCKEELCIAGTDVCFLQHVKSLRKRIHQHETMSNLNLSFFFHL